MPRIRSRERVPGLAQSVHGLPAYATRELLVEKVFAVTVFDIGGFGMA